MIYQIDARFYCPNRFCEVRSDDSASTESVVEELISMALLTLFERIQVENVSVDFPLISTRTDEQILISIQAQGEEPFSGVEPDSLDGMIEDRLSCVLLELFGLLDVERCAIV
jgi:hypothetical protein